MALVLADVGADEILKVYLNNDRPGGGNDLTLKLFTSNTTPADTDTSGTYTEAAGGGYVAKTLTCGSWTVTVGNDPSDATYAEQVWTFTGALTLGASVYGYYIVDSDGALIWAERFASNFTPAYAGDKIYLTPKIQLSKGTPT
jgi:hypothetical protein